jgi:uncharacterized protein
MTYVVVGITALLASGLTFFTGFGLGTLLLPAFALFFAPSVAIALTAIVHFLNGVFKLVLIGKHVHWRTVLRFGLPAALAALVGARALLWLSDLAPIASYTLAGRELTMTPVKVAVSVLMFFFAVAEVSKRVKDAKIAPKWMPLGGVISGFFGGLSGHQGAFRSAFLVRAGLDPKAFVATGAMIALGIDVSRLATYFSGDALAHARSNLPLVVTATAAAFAGAYTGNRLLHKVTLKNLQIGVAVLLTFISVALFLGLI